MPTIKFYIFFEQHLQFNIIFLALDKSIDTGLSTRIFCKLVASFEYCTSIGLDSVLYTSIFSAQQARICLDPKKHEIARRFAETSLLTTFQRYGRLLTYRIRDHHRIFTPIVTICNFQT